jgi:hypothetical protein
MTKPRANKRLSECTQCRCELPCLSPLDVARRLDGLLAEQHSADMLRIHLHQLSQQLHGLCVACSPRLEVRPMGGPVAEAARAEASFETMGSTAQGLATLMEVGASCICTVCGSWIHWAGAGEPKRGHCTCEARS